MQVTNISQKLRGQSQVIQSDVKIKRNYVKFLSEFGQYVLTEREF